MITYTYIQCKKIIENGKFVKEDLLENIDIFLLNNRITKVQYEELLKQIG